MQIDAPTREAVSSSGSGRLSLIGHAFVQYIRQNIVELEYRYENWLIKFIVGIYIISRISCSTIELAATSKKLAPRVRWVPPRRPCPYNSCLTIPRESFTDPTRLSLDIPTKQRA